MLQKVAAMVDKVAADLCFRASKVRWLLPEKYFDFAASSAAGLLLDDNINNLRPNQPPRALKEPSLYIIVVLNTQRFSALVLEIGDFCDKKAYLAYGSCCIIITSAIVYFFNKSF